MELSENGQLCLRVVSRHQYKCGFSKTYITWFIDRIQRTLWYAVSCGRYWTFAIFHLQAVFVKMFDQSDFPLQS